MNIQTTPLLAPGAPGLGACFAVVQRLKFLLFLRKFFFAALPRALHYLRVSGFAFGFGFCLSFRRSSQCLSASVVNILVLAAVLPFLIMGRRMRATALIIFFVICLGTGLRAQVGISTDEQKLFNLVNQERKKAGLPPFQWNYLLAQSARAHSQLMAKRKVLTHQFSGEPALGDRVGATGLRFSGAAENVAAGDIAEDTVARVHASLINSAEHRGNILNANYNVAGLAIVSNDNDVYVTEDFAHTLPVYSEEQFRRAVVAAFNKAREANSLAAVVVRDDPHFHDLACSESQKEQIPAGLPNALDIVVFTSSEPEKLPSDMQKAARDPGLHHLSIGTCFSPDKQHGYGNFWVVVALYP